MSSSVKALHPLHAFPYPCVVMVSQTALTTLMRSTVQKRVAVMSSAAVRVGASPLCGPVMAGLTVTVERMKGTVVSGRMESVRKCRFKRQENVVCEVL